MPGSAAKEALSPGQPTNPGHPAGSRENRRNHNLSMTPAKRRDTCWLRFGAVRGQVPLARRALLDDPVRLGISLGGLAFAVLLVLLLRGIMDGTVAKSTSYIDHVGADVFVAGPGVTDMSLASSALPQSTLDSLRLAQGVGQVGGILRTNIIVSSVSETRPAVLIGYDPAEPLGGPWALQSGRGVEASGEVVLDGVLAEDLGVHIGGRVQLVGTDFTVVGLSSGTTAIAGKLAFIDRSQAQTLLRAPDFISFALIHLKPGTDEGAFVATLSAAYPTLEVLTRDTLSENDRELLGRLFVEPINVMSTVGLLVGLAIVGLTMYTTIASRLRDFGVLKAIGASNAFLLRTVIVQALALGAAGFALGLAAVLAAAPLVVRSVPDIGVQVGFTPAVEALAAVVVMSLLGAIVPVVRILEVDPLVVFKR